MATTALFAELLVVGLQAEAWLVLLALTLLGTPTLPWEQLEKWSVLVTLSAVAVAYVLGIVVDRLADGIVESVLPRRPRSRASVPHKRLTVLMHSAALSGFLDYQRSRLRVARGTAANLLVGGPILLAYLWRRTDLDGSRLGLVAAMALGLLAAAVVSGLSIREAYMKRLDDAYGMVQDERENTREEGGAGREPRVAAAVCVDPGPPARVLLVQTRAGTWIFPKGRREDGEPLADTAARELGEEAGARGSVEASPFTTFRYTKPGGDRQEVAAFLVRNVELLATPAEGFRKPAWFSREDAAEKLCARRTPGEGAELCRVVDAALAQ